MAEVDYLVEVEELSELFPVLLAARDYWDGLRGDRRFPSRRDVDPLDIPQILPNVMLLDVLPPGADGIPDFLYRLTGTGIDGISLQCNTGRKVSELDHQRAPSQVHSQYCLAMIREAPVAVRLPYIGDDATVNAVDSLAAPLSSDGTAIDMLLCVITPVRCEAGSSDR